MKTVAAYIRVSTDDQVEFSPDSQIKAIRNYAKTHEMYLPEKYVFMDEGISGRTAEKRPAFVQMIGLAKSLPKPFDAILVWKYSRFARNREDSVVYKSMLRKQCNIDVISISENIGDDKMSILFEAMIEAMDEYYSINLAEEVKRGMTEKARRGGVLSIPGFGYTIKDGKYVIHPEQVFIIKKVFNDFINGKGMLTIAKELNRMHITTNRGNKIENRTIDYWLNNPLYIGKTRWNPNGKTLRDFHAEGLIIAEGEHEPIIDLETWNAAQKKLRENKDKHPKYVSNETNKSLSHWLTGVIRCGRCGAVLGHYGKNFGCSKQARGLCKGCGSISIHIAESLILNKLKEILTYDIQNIIVADQQSSQAKKNNSPNEILSFQLKKAEEKLSRIKEAYEIGADTLKEYVENKKKITNEIKNLQEEIKKISKPSKPTSSDISEKVGEKLINNVKRLIDILVDDKISNISKRSALQNVVKEVVKTGKGNRELKIIFWSN